MKQVTIDGVEYVPKEVKKDEWPKEGDKYYFTDSDGLVSLNYFGTDKDADGYRKSIGNFYKTDDELLDNDDSEIRRAIQRVKNYIKEHDLGAEWDGKTTLYGPLWDNYNEIFEFAESDSIKPYFPFGFIKEKSNKFLKDNLEDLKTIYSIK